RDKPSEIWHGVRAEGAWQKGIVISANEVWALSLAELNGHLVAVWADGRTQRVVACSVGRTLASTATD
ncbi:unnamed protein product, partial [marine sediment metagenome]